MGDDSVVDGTPSTPSPPVTAVPTKAPTPTATPTHPPTNPPVQAPTNPPVQTPTAPPPTSTASAAGDPHLVNIHGEHFSIFQSGHVTFLRVPYESKAADADFTLNAKIESDNATNKCERAQYITRLLFGGSRFQGEPLKVHLDSIRPGSVQKEMKVLHGDAPVMPSPDPIQVAPKVKLTMHNTTRLVLKVDRASVVVDLQYYFLNVKASSFKSLGEKLGGLLGEDDHSHFAMMPAGCEREVGTRFQTKAVDDFVVENGVMAAMGR